MLPISTNSSEKLFKWVKLNEHGHAPERKHTSAGYDIRSSEYIKIYPHQQAVIKTGIAIQMPEINEYFDIVGILKDRSSIASKQIRIGGGVIDSDYRGELKIIMMNHSNKNYEINIGDRICQLLLQVIITPKVIEIKKNQLTATTRDIGGFGST